MIDFHNTIKALEARIARLDKERVEVFQLLKSKKIRCVNIAAGLRRFIKRVEKARRVLK
jgi:hypothetical protein